MHRIALKRLKKQRGHLPHTRAAMFLCVIICGLALPDAIVNSLEALMKCPFCQFRTHTAVISLLLSLALPFWYSFQTFRLARTAAQTAGQPALKRPTIAGISAYSAICMIPLSLGAAAILMLPKVNSLLAKFGQTPFGQASEQLQSEYFRTCFELLGAEIVAGMVGAIATWCLAYFAVTAIGRSLPERLSINVGKQARWTAGFMTAGSIVTPFLIGDGPWLLILWSLVFFVAFRSLNVIRSAFDQAWLEEKIGAAPKASENEAELKIIATVGQTADEESESQTISLTPKKETVDVPVQ